MLLVRAIVCKEFLEGNTILYGMEANGKRRTANGERQAREHEQFFVTEAM
jgi:hypothetical protein